MAINYEVWMYLKGHLIVIEVANDVVEAVHDFVYVATIFTAATATSPDAASDDDAFPNVAALWLHRGALDQSRP